MMRHVSICLLLVYAVLVRSIEGCLAEAEDTSRYQQEIDAMPTGLHMYDDNDTLFEITTEEKSDPNIFALKHFILPNTFHLFTRSNPTRSQLLWINNREILAKSYFNARRPTRFVTHGWMNSRNSPACTRIRDAYLENDDYNVIVFDWSGIASKPYVWASKRVLSIGLEIARMINFLVDYGQLQPDETTLVGHSLGAHAMGLAGYYSKYLIRHVVGLDPALPMFRFAGPGSSISKMDAKQVQIIHTNGGFLGYMNPAGHTDFYPNGGVKQPGCLPNVLFGCACSHRSAVYFFAESIRTSKPFYGSKCDSYVKYLAGQCIYEDVVPMGGANLDLALPGKYYLSVKSRLRFFNVT